MYNKQLNQTMIIMFSSKKPRLRTLREYHCNAHPQAAYCLIITTKQLHEVWLHWDYVMCVHSMLSLPHFQLVSAKPLHFLAYGVQSYLMLSLFYRWNVWPLSDDDRSRCVHIWYHTSNPAKISYITPETFTSRYVILAQCFHSSFISKHIIPVWTIWSYMMWSYIITMHNGMYLRYFHMLFYRSQNLGKWR